jgi:hypothetical protein
MKTWFHRWPGEWQFEFLLGRLQVRIGSLQQAVWWYNRDRSSYRWLLDAGKRARAIRAAYSGEGVRD